MTMGAGAQPPRHMRTNPRPMAWESPREQSQILDPSRASVDTLLRRHEGGPDRSKGNRPVGLGGSGALGHANATAQNFDV